jgi:hypothetical protein
MLITPASTQSAPQRDTGDEAAGMAARLASGPGFWTGWLAELDRQGLLEELLADGVIARALREAPPAHRYDRVLTAKMTVVCVLVACLFPGAGYDTVLATAFGLPGLRFGPGTGIPTGSAFSQARKLLGEQVMQRLFELDAAAADADLGIGQLWKGLEVTAIIHNLVATAAARAAGSAGLDPGLIPFTAVLGLIRAHVAAEAPCRHCGNRPDSPLASLNAAILALPRHRQGRQRTSGRTAAERRTRHTEEVTYTIDITKSNLPKWDTNSGNLRAVALGVMDGATKADPRPL